MNDLRQVLKDYLLIRRQLGYKLKADERLLENFVAFLERAGAVRITTELAVMWAKLPVDARPHRWRQRLGIVRSFARYLATIDPDSEVPSKDLLPAHRPRVAPYIYSPAEIAALMGAAGALTPPLRAASYRTVIGLMATTGLRLGETLDLDRQDVDLHDGALHVRARQTKQREVPMHPSTTAALREYTRSRDRYCADSADAGVLPQRARRQAHPRGVQPLVREADRPDRPGGSRRARPAKATRSEAHAGGAHAAGLVRRGRGRGPQTAAALHVFGTRRSGQHVLVLGGRPRAHGGDQEPVGAAAGGALMSLLAPTLQAFFTERLITQRDSSPQTVAAYRDTFRLLLSFAHERIGKQPCELDVDDLDAPLIGAFLTHLEQDRGNSARTRNARLAAIHSLYRYMALRHPEHLQTIGRVIAIPFKRHEQNSVNYLNLDEIKALLRAPDRTTWLGRRDHALLLTAIQTGVRVTELVTLRICDVSLATGAHCRVTGKGRKRRTATLTRETVVVLRQWLKNRDSS